MTPRQTSLKDISSDETLPPPPPLPPSPLKIRQRRDHQRQSSSSTTTSSSSSSSASGYIKTRLLHLNSHIHSRRDGSIVGLEWGTLLGQVNPKRHIRHFLGIPYAKAPVGKLRWKRPVPPDPLCHSTLIFDARRYGPHCHQLDTWGPGFFRDKLVGLGTSQSPTEDCLTVNVHAPSVGRLQRHLKSTSAGLPVIFFIHGGMFTTGGTAAPLYQPADLVGREDVVVVTANYRLGLFGFLGGDGLVEEDPEAAGNYALHDLLLALQWTRQNVAMWGGDPERITLMGHSAGSVLASYLLILLRDRPGWISRAVFLSGAWGTAHIRDVGDPTGQGLVEHLAREVGASSSTDPAELRRVPAEVLNAAAIKLDWSLQWGPVTGPGTLFPVHPRVLYGEGHFAQDIPVLVTSCLDDGTIFSLSKASSTIGHFEQMAGYYFGPEHAEGIKAAYLKGSASAGSFSAAAIADAAAAVCRDAFFKGPVLELGEAIAAHSRAPVYYYEWHRPLYLSWMASPILRYGVFHGTELILFFGGIPGILALDWGGARSVQRRMMRFIRGGPPDVEGEGAAVRIDADGGVEGGGGGGGGVSVVDARCSRWRDIPINSNLIYASIINKNQGEEEDNGDNDDLTMEESEESSAIPYSSSSGDDNLDDIIRTLQIKE